MQLRKTFQKYVNRSAEAPCSASKNENHCKILTCHGATGHAVHHGYSKHIQKVLRQYSDTERVVVDSIDSTSMD